MEPSEKAMRAAVNLIVIMSARGGVKWGRLDDVYEDDGSAVDGASIKYVVYMLHLTSPWLSLTLVMSVASLPSA